MSHWKTLAALGCCVLLNGCRSAGYQDVVRAMERGDDQAALEIAQNRAGSSHEEDLTGLHRALAAKVSTRHLRDALAAQDAKDWAETSRKADLALKTHGGNRPALALAASAHGLLAQQQFAAGAYAAAERSFTRAGELDHDSKAAQIGRDAARNNLSCEEYEAAAEAIQLGSKGGLVEAIRLYQSAATRTPGFFDIAERLKWAQGRLGQLYLSESRHSLLAGQSALAAQLLAFARETDPSLPADAVQALTDAVFNHSLSLHVHLDVPGDHVLGPGLNANLQEHLEAHGPGAGLATGDGTAFQGRFERELTKLNSRLRELGTTSDRMATCPRLSFDVTLGAFEFDQQLGKKKDIESVYIDGTKMVTNSKYTKQVAKVSEVGIKLGKHKAETKKAKQAYNDAKPGEEKEKAKKYLKQAQGVTAKQQKKYTKELAKLAKIPKKVEQDNEVTYTYHEQSRVASYGVSWSLTITDTRGRIDGRTERTLVNIDKQGLRRWGVHKNDTGDAKNVRPSLMSEQKLRPELASTLERAVWDAVKGLITRWRQVQAAGDDLESQSRRVLMADRGLLSGQASLLAQARKAVAQARFDHTAPPSAYPSFEALAFLDAPWIRQLPETAQTSLPAER